MSGDVSSGHSADWSAAPAPLRLVSALSLFCGWVSAAMIAVAIAITCQMIFVRYVLNWSTVWQTETVVFLMVGATLVGLPYVQRRRGHVNVDLLPMMLPTRPRFVLAIVTQIATLLVVGLLAWEGYSFWHEAWSWGERSDSVWGPKLWVPYLAMPVGLGLFFLQLVADFLMLILGYERPFGLDQPALDGDANSSVARPGRETA